MKRNKSIIIILVLVIAIGAFALYAIQRGPGLFIKPPTEARIAFISNQNGQSDLMTMKIDGSDVVSLTNDAANESEPTWSPDMTEILYLSDKNDQKNQAFISGWNGKYSRQVTHSAGIKDNPRWMGRGNEISVLSSGNLYMVDKHGGHEEEALKPSELLGPQAEGELRVPFVYADWSPKVDAILLAQETDLGQVAYILQTTPGRMSDVQNLKPIDITLARNLDVAWSPVGLRVAAGFINRDGQNGLLVKDFNSMNITELFVSKIMGAAKPVWSPDGKTIAFEMWSIKDDVPEKCLGIYTIDASGGKPRPIVKGDAREPFWSPDGSALVYTLARPDGDRDIWRMNADGTGAVNLTNGKGDNSSPVWSPARKRS